MNYVVISGLTERYKLKWQQQFVFVERDYLESIWRRSEQAKGKRRRIIHVIDGYDVVLNPEGLYDFVIRDCYLWLASTLPKSEIVRYEQRVLGALANGSWKQSNGYWELEDLRFSYTIIDKHPKDTAAERDYGSEYQTIECRMQSVGFPKERIAQQSPWDVYNSGIRAQGTRVDNPNIVTNTRDIAQYFPAQIELGGGASLELGIPPLNYFHSAYNLYTKDHQRFAFGDDDMLLDELLPSPEAFYVNRAATPYAKALLAEPNDFYKTIAQLYNQEHIVGPVITNNFDGMCSLVGLPEMYVRRYDDVHIVPDITFDQRAKSLLVIGSHADRRRIQQAAKQQGLKVIYVDPERYVDYTGREIAYPLEKIEADDILMPLLASVFATKLAKDFPPVT